MSGRSHTPIEDVLPQGHGDAPVRSQHGSGLVDRIGNALRGMDWRGLARKLLLTGAAIALPAAALAGDLPEQPNPYLPENGTIELTASTPLAGPLFDIYGSNDFRLIYTLKDLGLHVIVEPNRAHGFNNGTDYFSLSLDRTLGGLDIAPGIRVVQPRDGDRIVEGSLYVGKQIDAQRRLNTLILGDTTRFGLMSAWYQGTKFDAGVKFELLDFKDLSKRDLEGFLGVHDKDGRYGLWAGINDDNTVAANGAVNLPGFGAYLFGKSIPDGGGHFASLWLARNGDGKQPGGVFGPNSGFGTIQAVMPFTVHPYIGPFGLFLGETRSALSAELTTFLDRTKRYHTAQAGGRVLAKDGWELYLGGGAEWRRTDGGNGIVKPIYSGSLVIPVSAAGLHGSLRIDAQHAPEGNMAFLASSLTF